MEAAPQVRVRGRRRVTLGVAFAALVLALGVTPSLAAAQLPTTDDPRVGLSAGIENPGTAQLGMRLDANLPKPAGFNTPAPGSIVVANSDMAFQGDYAFVGNFNGFNIYDISNPVAPVLKTTVVCPGGQGDLSVYGDLLFMSVEENRAKTDCTLTPLADATTRFRGVRIFDISDISAPQLVHQVQTCRGSHTHTLVTDDQDPANVYIYVQGTAGVRPATELAGCVETPAANLEQEAPQPETSSRWRIEVIKVPVAHPDQAAVVEGPRLFWDGTRINGLQNSPPTPNHPSGIAWQPRPTTDSCHDITVYPALDIAAGACEGNGLLIDISDRAHPERVDAVADPLFAYWHGATFSNDGRTVMFTDEWGGGTNARCRAQDNLSWGANAIYDIVGGQLEFRSYYKLPVAQTTQENCVSHIPSLVPVPGRDIFVQAWYQGGASLVDFSDSANPVEIGYFDRGPLSETTPLLPNGLGGLWSTYWYNGETYGSEIARGFDAFGLTPTEDMTANEIAAAKEVQVDRLNVQHQDPITWQPTFAVARSYADQLERAGAIDAELLADVRRFLDRAEQFRTGPRARAAMATLLGIAGELPAGAEFDLLRDALRDLAEA
jgi:hypothetical protein